ncbi:F-actin-monooxygenase MICAL3 [Orussus abietinus]|uniref:F-actin-monooxygenase MICAL3 n=1 Tax=Orussus abietinus TaxID=222816 RepID=UPI0006264786|nr:F-actin-monooxygenase MICAL3 [Orussus abietinus]
MEKEQPDSLATVAVGSEKASPDHGHYAPSEVYSASEPPPAYMRPATKSTAVQIARIAAVTLVTVSVVLGGFILAASWVQARASCGPEAVQTPRTPEREFPDRPWPEALKQEPADVKDYSQASSEPSGAKEVRSESQDARARNGDGKPDGDDGDNDEEDDYDDEEFPPVRIKLPLQLDLDDIAGTLMQQARSRVSCVVERRRADEVTDGSDNGIDGNGTDPQRFQRLSGERVAILCESGNPHQEQREQEMPTPIIVPLGTVQIPVGSQEPNYHRYRVHPRYQVPDMQQLPLSDPRGLNHIPAGILPPELRNLPQLPMEMRPPRAGPQIELRHFPMDPVGAMPQEPRMPAMFHQQEQPVVSVFHQEQPVPPMMQAPRAEGQLHEQQAVPRMMMPPREHGVPMDPQASAPERPHPFQGIPLEIRRIIQQVPLEIKNIIQQITGEHVVARAFPVPVPEGARRETVVQEFKPFPEGARPIPLGPFPLPIEVRNLLESGNLDEASRSRDDSDEERQEAKPFPGTEDRSDEADRGFPIPVEVRSIIRQVVEGRAPKFSSPPRPLESMEIPVQAQARIAESQSPEQQAEHHQHEQQVHQVPGRLVLQRQEREEENRPHYVQPRSVRSIPEPFAHRREKRVRRCACDCAC